MAQEYKIFVGGLTIQTTEADLEDYFEGFGSIKQVAIIKNKQTGLSKCYAFLLANDKRTYERILSEKPHRLNGRIIDCKDGFNKEDNPALFEKLNNRKIFVGGLSPNTQDHHLADHFGQFGAVFKAYVIIDPKTKRSKRFGFIIMQEEASVEKAITQPSHKINGTVINCKRFDRSVIEKQKLLSGDYSSPNPPAEEPATTHSFKDWNINFTTLGSIGKLGELPQGSSKFRLHYSGGDDSLLNPASHASKFHDVANYMFQPIPTDPADSTAPQPSNSQFKYNANLGSDIYQKIQAHWDKLNKQQNLSSESLSMKAAEEEEGNKEEPGKVANDEAEGQALEWNDAK